MGLYFSGETGGFYDDAEHVHIPADAVEITEEDRASLLAGVADGGLLQVSPVGIPIIVQRVSTYSAELSALNAQYAADRQALALAYASAGLADGESEAARKEDLREEHAELMAQYAQELAELKTKHGVV